MKMNSVLLSFIVFVFIWVAETKTEIKYNSMKTRIIHGDEATIKDFPFIVSLQHKSEESDDYEHVCAGSILKSNVILTAGHCILVGKLKEFRILAGSENRYDTHKGVVTSAINRFLHPSYNVILKKDGSLKDIAYDVALLILRDHLPTTFSKIKLSRKDLVAGDVAEVVGWGLINKYNDTDFLQSAQVSILDDNNCKIKAKVSVSDVICAVPGPDGGLPCVGDSGGPLVKNVTGKKYLYGVVSTTSCSKRYRIATFTKVYASDVLDWIIGELKKMKNSKYDIFNYNKG